MSESFLDQFKTNETASRTNNKLSLSGNIMLKKKSLLEKNKDLLEVLGVKAILDSIDSSYDITDTTVRNKEVNRYLTKFEKDFDLYIARIVKEPIVIKSKTKTQGIETSKTGNKTTGGTLSKVPQNAFGEESIFIEEDSSQNDENSFFDEMNEYVPEFVTDFFTNEEDNEILLKEGVIDNKLIFSRLDIIKVYLEFKGLTDTSVYKILTNDILSSLKSRPSLVQSKDYRDFIENYILNPIKNNNFNISRTDKKYIEAFCKITKITNNTLTEFKDEVSKKSIEEAFWGETFSAMDEQREEIEKIQKLRLNDLLKNKEDYLNLNYEDTRLDLENAIKEFRNRSSSTDNTELAGYLTDAKIEELIKEELIKEELFYSLKEELLVIYSYLEYKGNTLEPKEKQDLENSIKGIVGIMYFINGLHYDPSYLVTYSVTGQILTALNEGSQIESIGFLLGIVGLVYSKILLKNIEKNKFFKILDGKIKDEEGKIIIDNSDTGVEKKNFIKKINSLFNNKSLKLTSKEIDLVLKQIINDEGVLENEYKDLGKTIERLKKLKSLINIVGRMDSFKHIGFDLNSIFLKNNEFSRECLSKLFELNNGVGNKSIKGLSIYFGLGSLGRGGDLLGGIPLAIGKRKETFGDFNASKILENFINKYEGITTVSGRIQNLEYDNKIPKEKREKIKSEVNKIEERLVNKNIIISEKIVDELYGSLDEDSKKDLRIEIQKMLDEENLFEKTKIRNKDGTFIDNFSEFLKIFKEKILGLKFKKPGLRNLKLFKFGETDIEKAIKSGIEEFDTNNKELKDKGIISEKEIKEYIYKELKKELDLNDIKDIDKYLNDERLDKLGIDGPKEIEKLDTDNKDDKDKVDKENKKNSEVLKEKKGKIKNLNDSLPDDIKFDKKLISGLKDIKKIDELIVIINKIESLNKEFNGIKNLYGNEKDQILQDNKASIEESLKSKTPFIIDSRIEEMLGDDGEIKKIKKMGPFISQMQTEDWFKNSYKDSIVSITKKGLLEEDIYEKHIDNLLKLLLVIDNPQAIKNGKNIVKKAEDVKKEAIEKFKNIVESTNNTVPDSTRTTPEIKENPKLNEALDLLDRYDIYLENNGLERTEFLKMRTILGEKGLDNASIDIVINAINSEVPSLPDIETLVNNNNSYKKIDINIRKSILSSQKKGQSVKKMFDALIKAQ